MTWRFADKPVRTSPGILSTLQAGEWLAQTKMDGWRCYIEWDGKRVSLTSRHREGIPAALPLREAITEILRPLPPVLLDSEWMGRRDNQREGLWLFDLLAMDGNWLGQAPAAERWSQLVDLLGARVVMADGPVRLVECTDANYEAFFQASKLRAGAEGIVLKRKDSRFIGSVRRCVENPAWLKCRWREGEDGQLIVA